MLVILAQEEKEKFPKNQYSSDGILISSPSFTFELLAQNREDYRVCGKIAGDSEAFLAASISYQEVSDIPVDFEQNCLPPEYGAYLNYQNIVNGKARKYLNDTDWKVIRHRDQLAAGATTSLTDTEYQQLLSDRQTVRDSVSEQ